MADTTWTAGHGGRTIRRQRLAIAGLAGLLVLIVAGGQSGLSGGVGTAAEAPREPQYLAGGDKLYRIHPNGRIEYILVDFAQGTVEGIPGWALLQVDDTLTRDRMGSTMRVPRN